jgi:phosphoribosylformylglycinamidine (FGAM) synthase-like amidotransferase family enzyme
MQSGSDDHDEKKKSESLKVASNPSGLLQQWKKMLVRFNVRFQAGKLSCDSVREHFCAVAIDVLEFYLETNKSKKNAINVMGLIQSLKNARSNQDVVRVMMELGTTKELQKLTREGQLDSSLGRLVSHVRDCFFDELEYPKSIAPAAAFNYDELVQIPKGRSISNGEYLAVMGSSQDFIQFDAIGFHTSIGDTKLRLSVAEAQVSAAWDLIKDHFLSADSPIKNFKLVNMQKSNTAMTAFKNEHSVDINKESKYSNEEWVQGKIKEYSRLMQGGQMTIYLPKDMNDEVQNHIAQFLKKIVGILEVNQIATGVMPDSDRRVAAAYISGRFAGTAMNYVMPGDHAKNNADPILDAFSGLLSASNKNLNTPT